MGGFTDPDPSVPVTLVLPPVVIEGGRIGGGGLRGGSFVAGDAVIRLRRYEFVPGVRLSGTWRPDASQSEMPPLRIGGPGRLDGRFRLFETSRDLVFRVRGRMAGRRVDARVNIGSRLAEALDEEGSLARAAALPWRLRCGAPHSFWSARSWRGFSSPRLLTPLCASSAAAAPASPARG